jgi:hypothetical protein
LISKRSEKKNEEKKNEIFSEVLLKSKIKQAVQ